MSMFFKNRANAGKVIGGMIIILVVSLAVGLTGCTKRQNNITSESDITPTETEQAEYNDTSDKDAAAEPATDSTSEETPDITGEESGEDESENAAAKPDALNLDPELTAHLTAAADKGLIGLVTEGGRQYVTFGSYDMEQIEKSDKNEQVSVGDGEKETLTWEILEYDKENQKVLVLCNNIIAFKTFDDHWREDWEDCNLRRWLNTYFWNTAFSASEKEMISPVYRDVHYVYENNFNDYYKRKYYGVDERDAVIEDKLFLLSYDEYVRLIEENSTDALNNCRKSVTGNIASWWLRSKNEDTRYADVVTEEGRISRDEIDCSDEIEGICPALWIDLRSVTIDSVVPCVADNSAELMKDLRAAQSMGLIKLDSEESVDFYFGSVEIVRYDEYIAEDYATGEMIDLKWEVLEYYPDTHTALVLCKNTVADKPFDTAGGVVWESSSVRKWLNEEFFDYAFSSSEKKMIVETTISNSGNDLYGTPGSADTVDRLFLLSLSEMDLYYNSYRGESYEEREKTKLDGRYSSWWLRTPAASGISGVICDYVDDYGADGCDFENGDPSLSSGICPACYISLAPELLASLEQEFLGEQVEKAESEAVSNTLFDEAALEKALGEAADKGLIGIVTEEGKKYVTFGAYDMGSESTSWDLDGATVATRDGEKETLKWEILDYSEDTNRVLLVTKDIIDYMPYNVSCAQITWEKCTARSWLNSDFIEEAFNDREKSMLVTTLLSNPKGVGRCYGGNDTEDRVFLLSLEEFQKYYHPTIDNQYRTRDIKTDLAGIGYSWWLRTSADIDGDTNENLTATCVRHNIIGIGDVYRFEGIRPAIWIDLNADIDGNQDEFPATETNNTAGAAYDYQALVNAVRPYVDNQIIELNTVGNRQYIVMGSFDIVKKEGTIDYSEKVVLSNDGKNEELEWEVLYYSEETGKALVLSRGIITYLPFDDMGDNTWEASSLRNWLNSEFVDSAFSMEERNLISENAGDMVFIFSSEDVEKYYAPTCIYADRYSDICEDGTREFRASWLKDTLAAHERLRSTCCYYGTGVISRYGALSVERLGVCPAMWIDLNQ